MKRELDLGLALRDAMAVCIGNSQTRSGSTLAEDIDNSLHVQSFDSSSVHNSIFGYTDGSRRIKAVGKAWRRIGRKYSMRTVSVISFVVNARISVSRFGVGIPSTPQMTDPGIR